MNVKICGITTKQAAIQAVEAGADFIGFVFADSKRKLDREQAKEIASVIPASVKKVGVFVNEDAETIKEIADTVGLDYIQLHGDESPAFCQQFAYPVIKAFQIKTAEDLEKVNDYNCAYYLLDSPAGKYRGGNGEAFDWGLVKHLHPLEEKIILAGGLHADNVQQAIAEVKPVGVDVSSGVETDGAKDGNKMVAFIEKAKRER
ncbi:phosphoribosylanthranilate isomerase [Aquibacillus sediminis]|uniref:phosphoribosylanthranilate isomerase n=1 Tax=Aquibacillus sediminis TaxID=2574734 RepID=UPI001109D51B|nr:phosphoribosylanthranilate isomerase [Aquibacillus sediminis]